VRQDGSDVIGAQPTFAAWPGRYSVGAGDSFVDTLYGEADFDVVGRVG
jgi:hypothetical protein